MGKPTGGVDSPSITVGTPKEYVCWAARLRGFFAELGANPDNFKPVDARYNYRANRITIYRLANPADELSIVDTISHEFLHGLLYQLGEQGAARLIDLVGRPAGNPSRIGGI